MASFMGDIISVMTVTCCSIWRTGTREGMSTFPAEWNEIIDRLIISYVLAIICSIALHYTFKPVSYQFKKL